MCVAAIIHKPVPLSDLQHMENTNPDGGGVGWLDKRSGRFRYIKGITAKDIHGMQEAGVMSYPYLLHFRWATHGPEVPELCHPFPVGVKALYDESSGEAVEIMMHNGTWGNYEKWIPDWLPTGVAEELSDTAVAAYVMGYFPDITDEIHWATAHATVNGSGEMHVVTTGSWDEYEGNSYSNLHWRPSAYSSYSDSNWWETWRGREWRAWAKEGASEVQPKCTTGACDFGRPGTDPPMGPREYFEDNGDDYQRLADDDRDPYEFGTFEDYVEAKYGKNVARLAMEIDPGGSMLTNSELESMALSNFDGIIGGYGGDSHEDDDSDADPDMVSEDAAAVNEWLSKQVSRKVY